MWEGMKTIFFQQKYRQYKRRMILNNIIFGINICHRDRKNPIIMLKKNHS